MQRMVRLNRINTVLADIEFPISPAKAARECKNITIELAEGSVSLSETIQQSHETQFITAEDLELELLGLLPRSAVGEPFQSEGDA